MFNNYSSQLHLKSPAPILNQKGMGAWKIMFLIT